MNHDENLVLGFFEKYRFLSNFHVADVYYNGSCFPSTEHAYQAAKAGDNQYQVALFTVNTPKVLTCREAKDKGQEIDMIPDLWDAVKSHVMLSVVFDKFWRHSDLRTQLLATGDKYLEETNHWNDIYWGVNYETRIGHNHLGKILMKVRTALK